MKKNVNIPPSEEQLKQLNSGKITPKELENILKAHVLAVTVKLFQEIVSAEKDADSAYNILKPYKAIY